jgi:hypothetical protein
MALNVFKAGTAKLVANDLFFPGALFKNRQKALLQSLASPTQIHKPYVLLSPSFSRKRSKKRCSASQKMSSIQASVPAVNGGKEADASAQNSVKPTRGLRTSTGNHCSAKPSSDFGNCFLIPPLTPQFVF